MRSQRVRTFRILAVCTGNQCRSPAVEWMLGRLLSVNSGQAGACFEPESAGTHGPTGYPVHPFTRAGLVRRGIRVEGHASRLLGAPLVERASLVLTADRGHRAQVVTLVPESAPSTFTLLEFARLAPLALDLGVMNPAELVAAAASLRAGARGPATDPARDDLSDPVQGTADDHEVMLRAAQAAVGVIADALIRAAAPSADVRPVGRRALGR